MWKVRVIPQKHRLPWTAIAERADTGPRRDLVNHDGRTPAEAVQAVIRRLRVEYGVSMDRIAIDEEAAAKVQVHAPTGPDK